MQVNFLQFVRRISTKMSKPRVFFDMTADGTALGRIVMEVCANLLKF
jgi:hypothetical protein